MKVAVIVPARLESSRFPRKLLADLAGKPVIQWVFDNLKQSSVIDTLIIATDSIELRDVVQSFGGHAIMTSPDHTTGTDRCAEVASNLHDYGIIINVQGDEPFIDPKPIEKMIQSFKKDSQIQIATLYGKMEADEDVSDPNVVKLVTNKANQALYFSRSVVPFRALVEMYKKHVGVYGFRRDILLEIAALDPTPLEEAERLEQLRWLDNGYNIQCIQTEFSSVSIDTPEDLIYAEKHLKTVMNK